MATLIDTGKIKEYAKNIDTEINGEDGLYNNLLAFKNLLMNIGLSWTGEGHTKFDNKITDFISDLNKVTDYVNELNGIVERYANDIDKIDEKYSTANYKVTQL